MVDKIIKANKWFGKYRGHIYFVLILAVMAVITDNVISDVVPKINHWLPDFLISTLFILGILVLFSFFTTLVISITRPGRQTELNEFWKKNLIFFLIAGFIILAILLNIKYGRFSEEMMAGDRVIHFIFNNTPAWLIR